ncbi:MAG TPA: protein-L-isoaspartate(D-aspartate) O-methyltransferase [Solirubrobacterales bacterium]|nr:protein-L-isoaspartate(D-aspartate) O-methyltransferase [Solirubrobacterales bacterium]
MSDFDAARAQMVEKQLRARGIEDERVLEVMGAVPREDFVPERRRELAYADAALPIGSEQTISQPWIVAAILQALDLQGTERALEIGTGSGYSTCLLGRLADHVISIERHSSLARLAAEHLRGCDAHNVELMVGDGSRGVPDRGPFDAIAVHAAAPAPPPALLAQLADGGRMVVPVAGPAGHEAEGETLTLLRRHGAELETTAITPCRFVPLIGAEGF